jgi:hypothetical protein
MPHAEINEAHIYYEVHQGEQPPGVGVSVTGWDVT